MYVGYLGPQGTYSEVAARKICRGATFAPYPSFFTLFSALKKREIDAAVIPIENALNGAVTQNLDLLQESDDIFADCCCSVNIDHRLITLKGADKSAIKRIYSHPQALAQCAKYLATNFPLAKQIETPSTADCLNMLKTKEDAGIAGAHCKNDMFEWGEQTISDYPNNVTRFLKLVNGKPDPNIRTDRVFFSVTCKHEVGGLLSLLAVLKAGNVNMTEIESRPIKDRAGEFRFFIEIEGDYSDKKLRETLAEFEKKSSSMKILGCY